MAGAGFKTFSAGAVLTAAEVNTYLMQQSVMVFGGTAARSSAIPTPSEGMVTYLSDLNDIQAYDGSSWISTGLTAGTTTANYGWPIPASGSIASLGTAIDTTVAGLGSGLTLITSQTIGTTVSTVTVSGCFSSSYKNYRIIMSGGVGSAAFANVYYYLDGITTGWYSSYVYANFASAAGGYSNRSNQANAFFGTATTNAHIGAVDLINPNAALPKISVLKTIEANTNGTSIVGGSYNASTVQATDLILVTSTGTLTGGTIKVYGYED